ncbi:hypothetical protein HFO84_33710 [Rhizobium leguminosarum]|uniref:hypothetical protein n=1 Tax=Rhizobium leguminosarum TaxID=384 RepID=UPI001C93D939|nr:hypothetical protein [Rhizobium leguminosarum]MBY5482241.1 hypothetical protein [Rhizobium leguminosarum]
MTRIDLDELNAMLSDPKIPESALRPYLMLDPIESQGFRPQVVPNPATVVYDETEAAVALASLNGVSRWRRQMLYRQKIKHWAGLRVVEEGDSWFQYPFLIEDVVDHLFVPWAIYSCSGAGDLLSDMARQDEVIAAVVAERPDVVLLSGGGNDLLGDGRLARYLKPHAAGMSAADHVTDAFNDLMASIIEIYRDLIGKTLSAGARRVVCHSYDYAIPNGGPWLGRPMIKLGITDRQLQRDIIRILIDRFHVALTAMVSGFSGSVVVADCRGTVADNEWFDELHPTSFGFGKVARIIRAKAEGVEVEGLESSYLEAVEASRPLPVADVGAVEALLVADEATLIAEIGRRSEILQYAPDADKCYSLQLPAGSGEESVASFFSEVGTKVFDRWHRELYKLLCGDGGDAAGERDKLRSALKLEQAALIGAISTALIAIAVPVFIAPLVAAVIVKSGINPAWEVTCKVWGEKMDGSAATDALPDSPAH